MIFLIDKLLKFKNELLLKTFNKLDWKISFNKYLCISFLKVNELAFFFFKLQIWFDLKKFIKLKILLDKNKNPQLFDKNQVLW